MLRASRASILWMWMQTTHKLESFELYLLYLVDAIKCICPGSKLEKVTKKGDTDNPHHHLRASSDKWRRVPAPSSSLRVAVRAALEPRGAGRFNASAIPIKKEATDHIGLSASPPFARDHVP